MKEQKVCRAQKREVTHLVREREDEIKTASQ